MNAEGIAGALKFGTEQHRRIMEFLRARVKLWFDESSIRRAQIAKNEEQYQAYVKTSDLDRERKSRKETEGKQDYVTIEVPYGYATLMTAHTYFTSVFLARNPILQLQGRHGEGEMKTQAMEALLAYQLGVGQNIPALFIWLLDPGRAGFGVIGHYWDREVVRQKKLVEVQPTFLGMPLPMAKPRKEFQIQEVPGYVGHRLFNVRPQDFVFDPRVSLANFQRGEFAGRYVEVTWNEVIDRQKSGEYFNVDLLRKSKEIDDFTTERDLGSSNVSDLPKAVGMGYAVPAWTIKGYELCVRIVPRDWGLGSETSTEMWIFTFTKSWLLFGAKPAGLLHSRFPFDVIPCEPEVYNLFPSSLLERAKPFNDAISWLLNSHMYNVRATLNNNFIADPSRVVMKDVENRNPGKVIRLKPAAYGQDVRTLLAQLQTGDVTRSHIGDMQVFEQIVQRVLGVNDNVMGMVNSGGRKTATEVRSSTSFSVNRLKTACEWMSATGFSPLTQSLIQGTQDNYDTERMFRIVGDLGQMAPEFAVVTPDSIAGFFDFEPVDGTLPIDRFAQANLWQMLLGQARNFPQIMAQTDMVRLFGWVANLAGLKNFNKFRLQVSDPMALQAAAQAGNVVPLKGPSNIMEPRQIPGMGQTA